MIILGRETINDLSLLISLDGRVFAELFERGLCVYDLPEMLHIFEYCLQGFALRCCCKQRPCIPPCRSIGHGWGFVPFIIVDVPSIELTFSVENKALDKQVNLRMYMITIGLRLYYN